MKKLSSVFVLFLLLGSTALAGSISGDIDETCTSGNPSCQNNAEMMHDSDDVIIDADTLEGDSLDDIYIYVDDSDSNLQDQIDELNSDVNDIEAGIDDIWNEIGDLQTDIDDNAGNIQRNRNRIRNLRNRIRNLNNRLNTWIRFATRWGLSVERRLRGLQRQIDSLDNRVDDLEDRMDLLEGRVDEAEDDIEETKTYINNNEQVWTKDTSGMKFAKFWKVLLNWGRPVSDIDALRRGRKILDEFDSVENYLYEQFYNRLVEDIISGKLDRDINSKISENKQSTTTTTLKPKEVPPTEEELDCESNEFVRKVYVGEDFTYKCWKAESGNSIPVINGPILLN